MKNALLLFGLLCLLASGCYEDRIGCLDPDATDFDERADEACSDGCCTYPSLILDIDRFWGDTTLASQDVLLDGAGNSFELTRFRYYLTELELLTETGTVLAENVIETAVITGTDTLLAELNANLVLVESTSSATETAGTVQTGSAALTQVQGLFGMSDVFPNVYPPEAPSGSPLATQEGLLNFNDGNGYLLGSLEILLLPDSTVRRIDLTGNLPLDLSFNGSVEPLRGFNLTVEVAADYQALLGGLDLRAGSELIEAGLRDRLPTFMRVTGLR